MRVLPHGLPTPTPSAMTIAISITITAHSSQLTAMGHPPGGNPIAITTLGNTGGMPFGAISEPAESETPGRPRGPETAPPAVRIPLFPRGYVNLEPGSGHYVSALIAISGPPSCVALKPGGSLFRPDITGARAASGDFEWHSMRSISDGDSGVRGRGHGDEGQNLNEGKARSRSCLARALDAKRPPCRW